MLKILPCILGCCDNKIKMLGPLKRKQALQILIQNEVDI
jgi:hypothetical protein